VLGADLELEAFLENLDARHLEVDRRAAVDGAQLERSCEEDGVLWDWIRQQHGPLHAPLPGALLLAKVSHADLRSRSVSEERAPEIDPVHHGFGDVHRKPVGVVGAATRVRHEVLPSIGGAVHKVSGMLGRYSLLLWWHVDLLSLGWVIAGNRRARPTRR